MTNSTTGHDHISTVHLLKESSRQKLLSQLHIIQTIKDQMNVVCLSNEQFFLTLKEPTVGFIPFFSTIPIERTEVDDNSNNI